MCKLKVANVKLVTVILRQGRLMDPGRCCWGWVKIWAEASGPPPGPMVCTPEASRLVVRLAAGD